MATSLIGFQFPEDTLGWLTRREGRILFRYATRSAGLVVELGCYQGRSTICLAQGADRLLTVDHMQGDASDGIAGSYRPALIGNLERYDVRHKVQIVEADTAEAAALVSEPVSLLFIDGDHRRCQRDLQAWLPKVTGWVAFHDRYRDDVPAAIASLEGWRMVAEAHSLVVMKRLS